MTTPADILYTFLQDSGAFVGWTSFVSFLPDAPDKAICVYDTPGVGNGRIMRTGEKIEHPGIMVALRCLNYVEGHAKATSLALLLDSVRDNSVAVSSGETYSLHNVSRTGTINAIGLEMVNDRRRHQFTINAVLTLTELTA